MELYFSKEKCEKLIGNSYKKIGNTNIETFVKCKIENYAAITETVVTFETEVDGSLVKRVEKLNHAQFISFFENKLTNEGFEIEYILSDSGIKSEQYYGCHPETYSYFNGIKVAVKKQKGLKKSFNKK